MASKRDVRERGGEVRGRGQDKKRENGNGRQEVGMLWDGGGDAGSGSSFQGRKGPRAELLGEGPRARGGARC